MIKGMRTEDLEPVLHEARQINPSLEKLPDATALKYLIYEGLNSLKIKDSVLKTQLLKSQSKTDDRENALVMMARQQFLDNPLIPDYHQSKLNEYTEESDPENTDNLFICVENFVC